MLRICFFSHLPNISYQLGKQVPFSKQPTAIQECEQVFDTFQTLEKNLAWGCGLNLHDMTYRLGRTLNFDPVTERFVDDEQANSLRKNGSQTPVEFSLKP